MAERKPARNRHAATLAELLWPPRIGEIARYGTHLAAAVVDWQLHTWTANECRAAILGLAPRAQEHIASWSHDQLRVALTALAAFMRDQKNQRSVRGNIPVGTIFGTAWLFDVPHVKPEPIRTMCAATLAGQVALEDAADGLDSVVASDMGFRLFFWRLGLRFDGTQLRPKRPLPDLDSQGGKTSEPGAQIDAVGALKEQARLVEADLKSLGILQRTGFSALAKRKGTWRAWLRRAVAERYPNKGKGSERNERMFEGLSPDVRDPSSLRYSSKSASGDILLGGVALAGLRLSTGQPRA